MPVKALDPFEPDPFEEELRAALRREPAPPDFARKLRRRLPVSIWRRPIAWAMAAGLLLAAAIPPAAIEHRRRQEARALEAGRQLEYALQLTSAKLRQTRERVHRATKHTI
jgi:hypothetical protein